MCKKKLFIAIGLSFLFTLLICLTTQRPSSGQECRIIRIIGMELHQSIGVEPESLLVSKGDCVVWFNRVSAEGVKVSFKDAKKCVAVTNAPVGFNVEHDCYATGWIPFAGTASLRFIEKGTYEYVLETKGMPGVKIKGTIEVN